MKRYRVVTFDFDTRANTLKLKIEDSWEPKLKKQWELNKYQITEGLIGEFGAFSINQKITNFMDLGIIPFSLVAFHNKFYKQIREAFIIGAYYPSLVATCSLGERILNQLILHLRDEFRGTQEYKKVYNKKSFDNWDIAIDTLESWGTLLPNIVKYFTELKEIRNKSIHFNPESDKNDRNLALSAIKKLSEIIAGQFSAFGLQPWFIPGIPGVSFIKKSYEDDPFVKKIVIPNCRLVGYLHELDFVAGRWIVKDDHDYEEKEVSDEEFRELYNNSNA